MMREGGLRPPFSWVGYGEGLGGGLQGKALQKHALVAAGLSAEDVKVRFGDVKEPG